MVHCAFVFEGIWYYTSFHLTLYTYRSASPKIGAVMVMMTVGTSRMRRMQSVATFYATPKPDSAAKTTGVSPGGACVTRWTTVETDQMKTIWIYVRNDAHHKKTTIHFIINHY